MASTYSTEQITVNLDQIIQKIKLDEPIKLTHQGKEIGIIISIAEYEHLIDKINCFGESLEQFRQEYDVESADINPEEIFTGVRERSSQQQKVNF